MLKECGCCGSAKQLIADDSDVYLEISTNPLLQDDPIVDRMNVEISESNNGAWCSMTPDFGRAFDPYLTFEFNSIYLIEVVGISGDPGSGGRHITALTFQNNTGQGFGFINDNSGMPQVRLDKLSGIGSHCQLQTYLTTLADIRYIFSK